LTGGTATSGPITTLTPGAHKVVASYGGSGSFEASQGTFTQLVRYGLKVLKPASGARFAAGSIVPVAFQLTDAAGAPIPLGESILLTLSGRLTVSASGAQSLPPIPVLYDPFARTFNTAWFTVPKRLGGRTGAVTITVSVAYPDAPTQQVTVPITLT
jgi:hypothetical protein